MFVPRIGAFDDIGADLQSGPDSSSSEFQASTPYPMLFTRDRSMGPTQIAPTLVTSG
jgi:hypothetical protein